MKSNKVAAITGSAGGLGKGIALALAQNGFKVMLHDINKDALQKTLAEFQSDHYPAAAFDGVPSDDQLRLYFQLTEQYFIDFIQLIVYILRSYI